MNDLENEKLITETERAEIEEKGYVVIEDKKISFADGLKEENFIVTSSIDNILFKRIITEGDIVAEKTGYTNYSIEGISSSQDGEFVSSGSVEGKAGNLEIIGDIKDTTFKYSLTNFMQGDEIFYCKVNIDGEEYYQTIKVIQGDIVTYEEDFAGIQYIGDTWVDDMNENYTNGKILMQ